MEKDMHEFIKKLIEVDTRMETVMDRQDKLEETLQQFLEHQDQYNKMIAVHIAVEDPITKRVDERLSCLERTVSEFAKLQIRLIFASAAGTLAVSGGIITLVHYLIGFK